MSDWHDLGIANGHERAWENDGKRTPGDMTKEKAMRSQKEIEMNRLPGSFETIILPHRDAVFRRAMYLARASHQADDLTQETFLLALRYFHHLREPEKARAWLMQILRNLHVGRFSRPGRMRYTDVMEIDYKLADPQSPDFAGDCEGFSDDLLRELERLDEKYRTPLEMAVLERKSYQEISERLGAPVGTIMSRIHRAKKLMKKYLRRSTGSESTAEFYERAA